MDEKKVNKHSTLNPEVRTTTEDANAPARKQDHIAMAFRAQVESARLDTRFYYEPVLSGHPDEQALSPLSFLGKTLSAPVWVSSMTGGTAWAATINKNLARVCKDFGMGMGLGSCRSLLYSDEFLADFDVRKYIGDDLPLYANLGIAQVETLVKNRQMDRIKTLVDRLSADGLIIHINPLQEWLQPEGDRIENPPIETISTVLEALPLPLIVKEVGQGMGVKSLKALFNLPLEAIDFAGSGGTNFALLEMMRADKARRLLYENLAFVGHSAAEMTEMSNRIMEEIGEKMQCRQVIISGGVKNFLDGYYLIRKSKIPAIYGQASGFLKHAQEGYEELYAYVEGQIEGLKLAQAFLNIRD